MTEAITISPDQRSDLAKLSYQFHKATIYLKSKNRVHNFTKIAKKLQDEINKDLPEELKIKCNSKKITNYSNYWKTNPTKHSPTIEGELIRMLEYLDNFIFTTYQCVFNQEKYIKSSEFVNSIKLEVLFGNFRAYAYDGVQSNDSVQGEQYIHVFKLQIKGLSDIYCKTQNATFKKGRLSMLINTDRAVLEIWNEARKVYFLIRIGNVSSEDLLRRQIFRFAYVDSGDRNVKTGIALIERIHEGFNDIVPQSLKINTFNESPLKDEIYRLIKTQNTI